MMFSACFLCAHLLDEMHASVHLFILNCVQPGCVHVCMLCLDRRPTKSAVKKSWSWIPTVGKAWMYKTGSGGNFLGLVSVRGGVIQGGRWAEGSHLWVMPRWPVTDMYWVHLCAYTHMHRFIQMRTIRRVLLCGSPYFLGMHVYVHVHVYTMFVYMQSCMYIMCIISDCFPFSSEFLLDIIHITEMG